NGSRAFFRRSTALSMVCRPTIKAARISIRTEREALEYAVMPASARLISSPMQTKPIRRNRSDIGLPPRGGIQTLKDAIPRYQCNIGSRRYHSITPAEGAQQN